MKHLRPFAVALAVAMAALIPQTAGAHQPIRMPSQAFVGTFPAGSVCAFAVSTGPVGPTQTETIYFDRNHNVVKISFTGSASVFLTNDLTNKTIVGSANGAGFLYPQPDNSLLGAGGGPGLFALFPGDDRGPALLKIDGHETFRISPSGQIQDLVIVGKVTDLCAVLAT